MMLNITMTSNLSEIHRKADIARESNSPKYMGGYVLKDMNTSGAAIDALYLMLATCKDARLIFIGKSHFKAINYYACSGYMEEFVYKEIWEAAAGEMLICEREPRNAQK